MPTGVKSALSLGVAMIVRDEERVLGRCLHSIAGLYAELVIVDTGSTDNTIRIAKDHRARIIQYAGANGPDGRIADFADARNAALQAVVRSDWILQIDADEILLCGHSAIKTAMHESRIDAVSVRMRSEGAEWESIRLFRRIAAGHYVGKIHEYMEFAGEVRSCSDIIIENLPDKVGKESAYDRNLRIGLAEIEAGNGSSRVWHNLGNEHFRAGAYAEAARCYGLSLDIGGYPIGRFHGSFYKAVCHFLLNQIDQAMDEVSGRSIALGPDFAEAHCLQGDCLFMMDRFAEARHSYLCALACIGRRPSTPFPQQPWMEEDHPTRQLELIAGLL